MIVMVLGPLGKPAESRMQLIEVGRSPIRHENVTSGIPRRTVQILSWRFVYAEQCQQI